MGSQKIQIKRTGNGSTRRVCFSKRKTRLFKKLWNSRSYVALGSKSSSSLIPPPGRRRPFSFLHARSYVLGQSQLQDHLFRHLSAPDAASDQDRLIEEYSVAVETARKRRGTLKQAYDALKENDDVSRKGLAELERDIDKLKRIREDLRNVIKGAFPMSISSA